MDMDVFVNFLFNILLLMSLSVIYSVFKYDSFIHPIIRKILMGIMVSIVVGFIMYNSYVLESVNVGIMFDTRAVLLSVSGMFFGLIPTLIGVATALVIRIIQGGVGALTGSLWIIVSASLGLLWRKYRLKNRKLKEVKISWIELYLFGLVTQIVMILLFFTMPQEFIYPIINEVAFPLLVIYPIGSFFISQFLLIQRRQYFKDLSTSESERQYRNLFSKNPANLMLIEPSTGKIVDANEVCVDTYGYTINQLKTMNISSIHTMELEDIIFDLQSAMIEKSNFHHKHLKKSGVVFDVEIYTSKITIENHEYIYYTAIDVSEKVQSQKMFKDADERLKSTLLSVGEGVVVTDEFNRITVVNNKALSLINKTGPLERHKVFDEFRIYSNKNDKSFEEIYRDCTKNNVIFRSDNSYSLLTSVEDKIIFIDFTISPINNHHGVNHGAILVLRDVTIEKERQEEIRFMSKHDYLTGLYNRYNFESELERLNTKRQLPISLIIGDLNGLKLVNDAFGHLEGDKLIKEVANIFKKATRSEDIVARWGGDEFAILLPQTDEDGAESVKNRIMDLCEKSMYSTITPSIAIGYATKFDEEQDIHEILSLAEELMYTDKRQNGPKMRKQLVLNLHEKLNLQVIDNKSHSDNMCEMIDKYCAFYNIPEKESEDCKLFAKYHDIGQISIDKNILNKPSSLLEQEWAKVKTHSEIGSRLVATIPELQHLATNILQHHEWFDGSGYPQGLKGNEISEKARLLAIFDAYESITNNKVFRYKRSHDEAINEILKYTGTQFDPELVEKFIKIF